MPILLKSKIERKYSNGIAFQWFYTFTRVSDDN